MRDSPSSPPDFTPVPLRARRDGWTAERQRAFIAALRETRRVGEACRRVGMARKGAYQLYAGRRGRLPRRLGLGVGVAPAVASGRIAVGAGARTGAAGRGARARRRLEAGAGAAEAGSGRLLGVLDFLDIVTFRRPGEAGCERLLDALSFFNIVTFRRPGEAGCERLLDGLNSFNLVTFRGRAGRDRWQVSTASTSSPSAGRSSPFARPARPRARALAAGLFAGGVQADDRRPARRRSARKGAAVSAVEHPHGQCEHWEHSRGAAREERR